MLQYCCSICSLVSFSKLYTMVYVSFIKMLANYILWPLFNSDSLGNLNSKYLIGYSNLLKCQLKKWDDVVLRKWLQHCCHSHLPMITKHSRKKPYSASDKLIFFFLRVKMKNLSVSILLYLNNNDSLFFSPKWKSDLKNKLQSI